jgi:hypothetical protein
LYLGKPVFGWDLEFPHQPPSRTLEHAAFLRGRPVRYVVLYCPWRHTPFFHTRWVLIDDGSPGGVWKVQYQAQAQGVG